jgi:hypothetical protein
VKGPVLGALAGLGAALTLASGPVVGVGSPAGHGPSRPEAGAGVPLPLHAEKPPAGHTGGFGEPTCAACHTEFPVNEPGGSLSLDGLPDAFEPGREYVLTVVLQVPETARAGFQISARHGDGTQAGRWAPLGPDVAVVDSAGVAYAHATLPGADAAGPDGASWSIGWTAPESGPVRFNVAANSANGDNSPFGDLVYAMEAEVDVEASR